MILRPFPAVFRLVNCIPAFAAGALFLAAGFAADSPPTGASECWKLATLPDFCARAESLIGQPAIVAGTGTASPTFVRFDGRSDGVEIQGNPIAGWQAFTIEVLMRPDRDGPAEQRFLHIDVPEVTRALLELRMDDHGTWCLDSYLRSRDNALALIDWAKRHPAGKWTWVALRYDGTTMAHFVDGVEQARGAVAFAPMPAEPAITTLGVRANRVSWFKGGIAEVRFTPTALPPEALQRIQAAAGAR